MSQGYQGDLLGIFGQNGFDTQSVEPQSDFDVIPPGKYPVLIEKAEVKQTKAGNGHYIELTLSVIDGPAKKRKVWDRININNPNPQCVEIGLRQLAALGQAIGIPAIGDTAQLVGQACIAHVKVKNEQNEVRTYSPLAPAVAPGTQQGPQQGQPYNPPPQASAPHLYQTKRQERGNSPGPVNNTAPQAVVTGKPPWAR